MAQSEDDRKALGQRLAAARKLAGLTMQQAADALTARGYPIKKQGVGHWETGRNLPDALWLRRLARLYQVSADALLWDESLSPDAMKIAAEFDHLNEQQKASWRLVWLGYVAATSQGGELLPMAPSLEVNPAGGRVTAQQQVSEHVSAREEDSSVTSKTDQPMNRRGALLKGDEVKLGGGSGSKAGGQQPGASQKSGSRGGGRKAA